MPNHLPPFWPGASTFVRAKRDRWKATCPAPPLVARVLRDEGYYGDGPPTWSGAPTSNEARKARKKYVKRLWRFSAQCPEAKAPAKSLARCRPHRRCMSGACPECGRAFRRFFVAEVKKLTRGESGRELISVSIAFPKFRVDEGQLKTLDATAIKRCLSEVMKDIDGLAWMAGGIDLSLNDDTQKRQGLNWQAQFYGIAAVASRSAISKCLSTAYPATESVRRPVQTKQCDGSAKAISYAYKIDFVLRIAYRATIGPPDHPRKCWHTRKVSLRPPDHVKAMLWMHRTGFAGRLYLRGVRMTRTGNSVGLIRMRKLE